MKFIKTFHGVPNGEIYPVKYSAGDECPPELEAGAAATGAIEANKQEGTRSPTARGRSELDEALLELPGEHNDADYVVNGMRSHFGAVFTADDEAKVRDLVKPAVKKPSDGLKVEELKAALAAKGVEIPEGVTHKADLAALLDGGAA